MSAPIADRRGVTGVTPRRARLPGCRRGAQVAQFLTGSYPASTLRKRCASQTATDSGHSAALQHSAVEAAVRTDHVEFDGTADTGGGELGGTSVLGRADRLHMSVY